MPIPRFRIRTLMIAVAVVGLFAWASVIVQRILRHQRDCRTRIAYAASCEAAALLRVDQAEGGILLWKKHAARCRNGGEPEDAEFWEKDTQWWVDRRDEARVVAAYYREMRSKYDRAASRPWLPLPPDPPPPN